MRDSVVRPIEDAVAGSPNLQTQSSNIQAGQATISAAFTLTLGINTDLVNVQKSLQSATHSLPSDLQAPTVNVRDPSEATVVTLSLTSSKMSVSNLSLIANGLVVPSIEQIPDASYDIRGDIMSPQSMLALPIAASTTSPGTGSGNLAANTGAANPWTSAAQVLRFADVASVIDGFEPRRTETSVNGINGVFLAVQKTSDSSEVTASDNVIRALPSIRAQ